jgi:RHS repeat-associated protein
MWYTPACLAAGGAGFIHSDHLGSTSLTTDITGTVVAETRYLPYGEERWITGTLVTDFTFTGQRAERGFGLMDYNARYYDPGLGHFVSADTVVPEYTNPQALNRYAYTYNNPLRFVDPSGHLVPPRSCWVCGLQIDISGWPAFAKRLASVVGSATDFHVDLEQSLITGPTEQEWIEPSLTNMVNPIGMVEVPVANVGGRLIQEGVEQVGEGTAQKAAEQGLNAFSRTAEFGIKPYNQLKKLTKGLGLRAHHLIEKRFAKGLDLPPGKIPSVALTPEEHQAFTNAWRETIGHNSDNPLITTANATREDVWAAAQKIYADYPELLKAVKQALFSD